jgi:hypothetical protein
MIKILVSIAAVLGLLFAPASAQAAPKDVSYSYPYVTLTDSNGEVGTFVITGGVKYSTKNGPVGTYCNYYRIPEGGTITDLVPDGYYNIPQIIPDASSAGVREHCVSNFVNRTRV